MCVALAKRPGSHVGHVVGQSVLPIVIGIAHVELEGHLRGVYARVQAPSKLSLTGVKGPTGSPSVMLSPALHHVARDLHLGHNMLL